MSLDYESSLDALARGVGDAMEATNTVLQDNIAELKELRNDVLAVQRAIYVLAAETYLVTRGPQRVVDVIALADELQGEMEAARHASGRKAVRS